MIGFTGLSRYSTMHRRIEFRLVKYGLNECHAVSCFLFLVSCTVYGGLCSVAERVQRCFWFNICGFVLCVLCFVFCVFVFGFCGVWFVVCCLWFVVCGLWFVVCVLRFVFCVLWGMCSNERCVVSCALGLGSCVSNFVSCSEIGEHLSRFSCIMRDVCCVTCVVLYDMCVWFKCTVCAKLWHHLPQTRP
jgi:hypothetical protein